MFDGATLGTLMIGLDSIRKEAEWSEPTTNRATPKASAFRARLAKALRFAADRLDRRTSTGLGSSNAAA
jgi:hypothetical protein